MNDFSLNLQKSPETVSVVYACDDAFMPIAVVSLSSLIKNRDPARSYHIYMLHTNISPKMQAAFSSLACPGVAVEFTDVSPYLAEIADRLPLRDYYSKTTYYRFFIADLFPHLKKAVYIDSDTIVQGDISRLFDTDLGDHTVAACHEQVMVQQEVFGRYAEEVVGVDREAFFNAGVMVINCEAFRARRVPDLFFRLLSVYSFAVTQDEDYLNVICKDRVKWLDGRWNTQVATRFDHPVAEAHILHYIMVEKPWHYAHCRHADIFWQYAADTPLYPLLCRMLAEYTDEQREKDAASVENLKQLARRETARADRYAARLDVEKHAPDRVAILKKIAAFERDGRFAEDVEDDPAAPILTPDGVDYLCKSPLSRLKRRGASVMARRFLNRIIKNGDLIIKEIRGTENWAGVESGAIVTCNHFNAFDSFAMQVAFETALPGKRKLYRVIREGNYTAFPGFYGFLMRNFYTLPLSSSLETMKHFLRATHTLLTEKNLVLVYPEQSMWWNYRKPKPLQKGAFTMAVRSAVPVLPVFITMSDTDRLGPDGYPVQAYTIHLAPPIYPQKGFSYAQNVAYMMQENARIWREIYENFYDRKLTYTTLPKDDRRQHVR